GDLPLLPRKERQNPVKIPVVDAAQHDRVDDPPLRHVPFLPSRPRAPFSSTQCAAAPGAHYPQKEVPRACTAFPICSGPSLPTAAACPTTPCIPPCWKSRRPPPAQKGRSERSSLFLILVLGRRVAQGAQVLGAV